MSQVRNLRAMFEGKGDTSPPDDRGRSSGASTPVPGGTESPRPLSKVRTNFVAIEKDGRIGLRRDPSHESSVSRRRLSMDTDAESVSTVPDKPTVALDDVAKAPRTLFNEPIPESPRQPTELGDKSKNIDHDIGAVSDKPSTNPDKHVDEESSPALLTPAEPTEKSPIQEPKELKETKATPTPVAVNGKHKTEKLKEPASTTPAKPAGVKKTTTRPSTISTKPTTTKPPAKSPSVAKTPTSATHKTATRPAVKAPEKTVVKKELATTPRAGTSTTRNTASSVTKKPQPLKTSASDTGFVKPKPKSPTKPVHLPASLMAPTASSVSKGSIPRQTLSRQSNSMQSLNAPGRPASRASVSTTHTNVSAGKTVKRQSSTINRPRPSLGPPPKKTAHDHPVTKKEAHVDEGFLARMMRPTQASSQKTTEKVPVTPPRKTAKRPSTGAEHKLRREASVKNLGSAKKPARKHAESSTSSEATAPIVAEPTPKPAESEEVAIKEPTKESVRPQTPVETSKEPEAVPDTSVEEVAVETANVETAQEISELAKEADLVEKIETPEEAASETKVEEPVSLKQLKVEVANAKPEEPAFDEPKTPEEKTVDDEEEESVATLEDASINEEPEKSEEVVSKDESAATHVDTPSQPIEEKLIEAEKKPEDVGTSDVTTSNLEKEMEKLKLVDEKPVEGVNQDSESVTKDDTATN